MKYRIKPQWLQKAGGCLMLSVLLSGCAFYTSLLGYPRSATPVDFSYYDANFKAKSSANVTAAGLRFAGFYAHHDTTIFEYGSYEGQTLVRKKGTTYRYLKFLDDGRVVRLSTTNQPDSATNKRLGRAPWFATGYYAFRNDTIRLETKNELQGNKSYFQQAVIHENGLRLIYRQPKKPLVVAEYDYHSE